MMGLLDLITAPGLIPILPPETSFINKAFPRSMRMLRLLQILKQNRGLSDLMQTLRFAAPGMTTVGTLMGVMYFVYAIAAMSLFGEVLSSFHTQAHTLWWIGHLSDDLLGEGW
jgi:hypothetical protein